MPTEKETQKLIRVKQFVISDKFLVRISVMDTGACKPTYLVIIKSLLDSGFKMQFFNDEKTMTVFLQTLSLI